MSAIATDPVSLIVGAVVAVLFLAIMVYDLWSASGKPSRKTDRCPRCGSHRHTDCNDQHEGRS